MDKLQISFKSMDSSPAVVARIRERIARLERLCERIVSCHVTVEAPHRRKHQGKLFAVKIHLETPRERIVVSHDGPLDPAHDDAYVAIRDAFDAATRQLEDRIRRLRGDVKTSRAASRRRAAVSPPPVQRTGNGDDVLS